MTSWKKLTAAIERMQQANSAKKACVGFDGYVDSLYRVIRSRESVQVYTPYETIADFAQRISQAAGRSADMELVEISRRMGGNAPLMAEALARLGISTQCIGAMGYPELDDVFSPRHTHFTPCSVAPSAKTIAFEFDDGKLMFGHSSSLHTVDWECICQTIGLDRCRQLYRSCDLWGVVNWSFVIRCNDVIEGFLRDVMDACSPQENAGKLFFFDLADPTGRPAKDLLELCRLMRCLSQRVKVVLGLNVNESICLADTLGIDRQLHPQQLAQALQQNLGVYLVAIHGLDYAVGATAYDCMLEKSRFNEHPAISTGGGDNFNAGLCTALLNELSLNETLAFANMVSSCYVGSGQNVTLTDLKEYIAACIQDEKE